MAIKQEPIPTTIEMEDAAEQYDPTVLTKEQIKADIRQALKEMLAGDLRPAREVLDEIEREMSEDADQGSGPVIVSEAPEGSKKEVPLGNT